MSASLNWSSAARSHVGRVRKLNEDACLELSDLGLWVIADGMGGHSAGDVASQMVVDTLRNVGAPVSLGSFLDEVRNALQDVNQALVEEANRRQAQIIGSTIAALLAYEGHCVSLWAGDSRIYLYRDAKLRQLTHDHSQVEELIARGLLDREDAKNHPMSNAITRAVGVSENLELDSEMLEVQQGDTFLLCSDGLYNEVSVKDIEKMLASEDCNEAAEQLLEAALQHGARDNVTVIVVQTTVNDQITKTVFNPSANKKNSSNQDEDVTTINS
jgi:protein phosphatase